MALRNIKCLDCEHVQETLTKRVDDKEEPREVPVCEKCDSENMELETNIQKTSFVCVGNGWAASGYS